MRTASSLLSTEGLEFATTLPEYADITPACMDVGWIIANWIIVIILKKDSYLI